MTKNDMRDEQVARIVKLSRVQINRLRRGKSTASVPTAQALEKLTGIKWYWFLRGEQKARR